MAMNKGIVAGVVRGGEGYPVKGALVRFKGLSAGSGELNYWNTHGVYKNVHIVHSGENGRFVVKFLWEKADIGDFLQAVSFRIFVLGGRSSRRDWVKGRFYVAPDIDSLVHSIIPSSFDEADAAEIAGFKLPGAFKTVLTPRLSTVDMVGFGYGDAWIE